MNFSSIEFLIFFSVVFALYFFVPHRFKWVFLVAAGLYFYSQKIMWHLVLLVIPILLIYFITRKIDQIEEQKKRKRLLLLGLFSSLAGLIVFRYTDFLGSTFYSLWGPTGEGQKYVPFGWAWPIGISFFSFKLVSYLMDVYNQKLKAEKHLGYLALYVLSFPQILAGPIDRAINFIPQLKQKVDFDIQRIASGFRLVAWGFFKKLVVADRLSIFVNEIYTAPDQQGINILFAIYFFSIQIYCDFSGYSDIAIGLSRILGFESMKNFDYPYFAKSMTQFWNRWHISLSTWLRDYLFLPIAYAVMRPIKEPKLYKIKAETWGYVIGMFTTMLLGGLWHGPTWNFVIWGCLHGIYLVVGYTGKKLRKRFVKKTGLKKSPKLRHFFSVFITFHLVSFAWVFFRAKTFANAMDVLGNFSFSFTGKGSSYLLFNLILVVLFIALEVLYKNSDKITFFKKVPAAVKVAGFALLICLLIIFSVDSANEFIYIQF